MQTKIKAKRGKLLVKISKSVKVLVIDRMIICSSLCGWAQFTLVFFDTQLFCVLHLTIKVSVGMINYMVSLFIVPFPLSMLKLCRFTKQKHSRWFQTNFARSHSGGCVHRLEKCSPHIYLLLSTCLPTYLRQLFLLLKDEASEHHCLTRRQNDLRQLKLHQMLAYISFLHQQISMSVVIEERLGLLQKQKEIFKGERAELGGRISSQFSHLYELRFLVFMPCSCRRQFSRKNNINFKHSPFESQFELLNFLRLKYTSVSLIFWSLYIQLLHSFSLSMTVAQGSL